MGIDVNGKATIAVQDTNLKLVKYSASPVPAWTKSDPEGADCAGSPTLAIRSGSEVDIAVLLQTAEVHYESSLGTFTTF